MNIVEREITQTVRSYFDIDNVFASLDDEDIIPKKVQQMDNNRLDSKHDLAENSKETSKLRNQC